MTPREEAAAPSPEEPRDRDSQRTRTYALVIVLEALVIGALWAFSRYFG
jgi:hypothetical protein